MHLSRPHIICGYEHLTYDMICVLSNNHEGDHIYVSLEEYYENPSEYPQERESNG
jgi:hypothetical protein